MVTQKFSWFVDLSTSADNLQVVKITAGGMPVMNRLKPFFAAYKYYKLGGVSVKFCPAATLPVDPTGMSYETGENTVDPRDQFNPGLIRITNGEDMADDLGTFTGDLAQQSYYNMMLDRRWFKFQLQTGCKRYAKPLFWSIAQLKQDLFPGFNRNLPDTSSSSTLHVNSLSTQMNGTVTYDNVNDLNSNPRGLFQTGVHERLSWMPTDFAQRFKKQDGSDVDYMGLNTVPEVELMKIILPKAYKTKYYYRVYITETVYFKDPVVLNYNGYGEMDRFVDYTGFQHNPFAGGGKTQDTVINPNNSGDGDLI